MFTILRFLLFSLATVEIALATKGDSWILHVMTHKLVLLRPIRTLNETYTAWVFTSRSWPHHCLYWMFLENVCIYSICWTVMIWLVQDAHQRGFRSGYTECRLIKWVYAIYLRIHSTTPLIILYYIVLYCSVVFNSSQNGVKLSKPLTNSLPSWILFNF